MSEAETIHSPEIGFQEPEEPQRSRLEEFWLVFRGNRLSIAGMIIFALFFFTALTGLLLTSGQDPVLDPAMVRLQEKLRPPMSGANMEMLQPEEVPALGVYLFGTDDLGRDVFARMLQGAWVSLTVGFVAVGISVIVGIFLGGLAGYFGDSRLRVDHLLAAFLLAAGIAVIAAGMTYSGTVLLVAVFLYACWTIAMRVRHGSVRLPDRLRFLGRGTLSMDTLIMRIVDIMLCFPSFFLILTVVALLPASIYNIMIIIGLTSWMGTTRFVRAEFLALRELDFVTAARALGVGNLRIIFRHMMPNAVAPVLVSATIGIATAILTEAGLSFLGFGVPPPHATWGNILSDGRRFIFDAPWLTFIPGIAILVVVLSFNLFGEGLRDSLNPKLKERY